MPTDHEQPCGPRHRSFCLNGGICYVIPTIPSPFCRFYHLFLRHCLLKPFVQLGTLVYPVFLKEFIPLTRPKFSCSVFLNA
uniref:Pro-neuregulin-4, membrane-bound isoform n=1 Tax=Mus musculus TaxID=10090 RepID=I6L9B2_MOUSE|nr:Nrg4 protein [Mus musculus]